MADYNFKEWYDEFAKDGADYDLDKYCKETNTAIFQPGLFYIFNYKPAREGVLYNQRPFIIALGSSKRQSDCILGLDLCWIPKTLRVQFCDEYFKIFSKGIQSNLDNSLFPEEADKQKMISGMGYETAMYVLDRKVPCKGAIKQYFIRNISKCYTVPFFMVAKLLNMCDENYFTCGTPADAEKQFYASLKSK